MPRIIVVAKDFAYNASVDELGYEVVVSPAVFMDTTDGKRLGMRKLGILRAMVAAVELSEPGDLIMQDDVEILQDPFSLATEEGKILTLTKPAFRGGHHCPQAFIIHDEDTRQELVSAWKEEELQSCKAWRHIPKLDEDIYARHVGGRGHG
jgi:hypothetical protein